MCALGRGAERGAQQLPIMNAAASTLCILVSLGSAMGWVGRGERGWENPRDSALE